MEVAEALFDLARMCTQPPPSASAVEAKKESRAFVNEVKSEAKQEPKVGGSSLPPHAPNGHSAVPSGTSVGVASVAGGSVRSNSPGVASAASPAPSPPAAAAASAADGMVSFVPVRVVLLCGRFGCVKCSFVLRSERTRAMAVWKLVSSVDFWSWEAKLGSIPRSWFRLALLCVPVILLM